MSEVIRHRKPKWLRVKLPTGENYKHVRKLVFEHNLHTICESGIVQIWENVGVKEQQHL